jgi:Flp pilus assembly protein TadD
VKRALHPLAILAAAGALGVAAASLSGGSAPAPAARDPIAGVLHALAEDRQALGRRAAMAGQTEDAIRLYREALHLRPDDAGGWRDLAALCDGLGKRAEAAYARKRAVELELER